MRSDGRAFPRMSTMRAATVVCGLDTDSLDISTRYRLPRWNATVTPSSSWTITIPRVRSRPTEERTEEQASWNFKSSRRRICARIWSKTGAQLLGSRRGVWESDQRC